MCLISIIEGSIPTATIRAVAHICWLLLLLLLDLSAIQSRLHSFKRRKSSKICKLCTVCCEMCRTQIDDQKTAEKTITANKRIIKTYSHIHHLQQQLDISRLWRCQLTHIGQQKWWWCGFSYTFFIPLHTQHTHRAIQYARYTIYITEKDNNRSRAMAKEKKRRSNITVTIECTSFRQLTTNHIQTHVHTRTKPHHRHIYDEYFRQFCLLNAARHAPLLLHNTRVFHWIELYESHSLFSLFIAFFGFCVIFFSFKILPFLNSIYSSGGSISMCVCRFLQYFQFF